MHHESSCARPHRVSEGLRVLVVDDETDARELELETFTPDVIVSDIGMPDEDGYSFIRTLRTDARAEKKNIPAIALTAFAGNEDRKRALVEGFNVHRVKPVEPAVPIRALADLAGHPRG